MELTKADKEMLLEWGHSESDFAQIEEAFKKSKTKYEMEGISISREQAISLLGRETYLSGISRSAFHRTACRQTSDDKVVYFNSSNLFR